MKQSKLLIQTLRETPRDADVVSQQLMMRAGMIQTMLPTLALVYFVAIFDGIVARWIRRVSGGRESSTIYHRAKYVHAVGVTLLLMAWIRPLRAASLMPGALAAIRCPPSSAREWSVEVLWRRAPALLRPQGQGRGG